MIENKFAITLEGLQETSKRVIRETPRFRKTAILMPVIIIALLLLVYFSKADVSPVLLIIIGAALMVYTVNLLIKTPEKTSVNIFNDMKKKYGEPITHTRMTEGGILLLDQDEEGEDDRMFPFSTIRLIFATEHFIVAMTDGNRAVVFRKDSFLSGSAEELVAMFRAHCPTAKFDQTLNSL